MALKGLAPGWRGWFVAGLSHLRLRVRSRPTQWSRRALEGRRSQSKGVDPSLNKEYFIGDGGGGWTQHLFSSVPSGLLSPLSWVGTVPSYTSNFTRCSARRRNPAVVFRKTIGCQMKRFCNILRVRVRV
ncbi:hypothetical protein TNCV_3204101 [Trichonephila clavipes]|nr:hypothetical protein TNCV_3204101 [Trichonephila clavipes]